MLGQIGFKVSVVEGGYKAFRTAVLADLPELAARLEYRVVCGPTGSGKTRLLQALAQAGAQVLDLEGAGQPPQLGAGHDPRPAAAHAEALRHAGVGPAARFDPARPVFVESESKKVGNLAVPDALIERMRASACLRLDLPDDERVALLLEDYDFFVQRPEAVLRAAGCAGAAARQGGGRGLAGTGGGGRDRGRGARAAAASTTTRAMQRRSARNFKHYAAAKSIAPVDRSAEAMAELAREILELG